MTQAKRQQSPSPDAPVPSGASFWAEAAFQNNEGAGSRHRRLMAELARTAAAVDHVANEALAMRRALGGIANDVDAVEADVADYMVLTSPDASRWVASRAA